MSARIWGTADGRYVGDGHVDAVFLAAGTGDPRPDDFNAKTFEPGPTPADWAEEIVPDAVEEAEPAADEDEEATEVVIAIGKPSPAHTAKPAAKHK